MEPVIPNGLDSAHARDLVEMLNNLLANYSVYYQNLRGFHWNIRGDKFFELHGKFEELCRDASEKTDAIAERVLSLNGVPYHTFVSYLNNSDITEIEGIHTGRECMKLIEEYLLILLEKQRDTVTRAEEYGDDGTQHLLSPYISEMEKNLWMVRAYLNEKV